ncbi:hypothetical protein [uncultured Sphaerochaeta sp.]|uniref:hypothetical protein n=1 Tax=uncultured Sphaerochaeta sp. TaxID=886478 RepID=UPI002A0A9368|nr:hypothetical protein [uncultured Sphaerochaeta sp.]
MTVTLIRGSITTGKCFHNKSRVFGPAVVQAYELEQKANYPRIVVGLDVIKAGIANHANHHTLQDEFEYLKDLIKNDVDGQWYLDYFSTAFSEVDDELMVFDYINNLERIIINNIDRYKNDNRVLPKYLWMKSKYNEMVTPMINQDNIDRFKKNPEIKQGLESLSLIL